MDELARQLQSITGVTSPPQWQLRVRGLRDVEYEGWLADIGEDVNLARMRAFDLHVGSRFSDARRASILVNAAGVVGDVHGESSAWANEAAARVKYQLVRLRPWWGWLRTPIGGATLAALYLLAANGVLWVARLAGLISADTDLSWPVVAIVVLASVSTQWALLPTYTPAAGPTVGQWLRRAGFAALGIVASTAFGAWITQLLSATT